MTKLLILAQLGNCLGNMSIQCQQQRALERIERQQREQQWHQQYQPSTPVPQPRPRGEGQIEYNFPTFGR